MAKEYIERELVLRQLTSSYNRVHDGKTLVHPMAAVAFRVVRNTPTADVVEVKHGRWITVTQNMAWKCSDCGELSCCEPNYCPHCGAKMDGGANE